MKKSKYTEDQIAFALKQAETGTRVEEVCRKFGIFEATLYNWKKKYGGMGVSELRRLKQLEDENRRLKGLVADLSLDLDKEMLQEVIKKSSEACHEARIGRLDDGCLPGQCQTGERRADDLAVFVLLLASQLHPLQL